MVSKSSSRVGAVEEGQSSGKRELTGGNLLRLEALFFSGNVAPGVAKV